MGKSKSKRKRKSPKAKDTKPPVIKPEEALQFLEDMRIMASEIDEPTKPISLRIPGNILRALRIKAKADGKKYQSLIIEYVRKGLKS